MPLPVTDREKNACPIAQIQTMGSRRISQRGVNMNLYPSAAPGRNATRTARTAKMRKNTGIMIRFVFSMLCAPRKSVKSVPATTIIWYGITEKGREEKSENHTAASAVISVPTTESTSALRT